jgi:23S rRNA (cytosine1962-C5)-methyltransferase
MRIYLKKGREAPVLRGHPWIFSGAIESAKGDTERPGVADVFDATGKFLARGLFSPKSQIRVRILTSHEERIDQEFFSRRIAAALAVRERYLAQVTNAYRIINGEGDFLPGLIVDRYTDYLVCQFFTAGTEAFKSEIVTALSELPFCRGVFDKSEGRVRVEEGLEPSIRPLSGDSPPEHVTIEENGYKFVVDIIGGQKTGFFLDQRDNRTFLATLVRGASVLNCFSYTGAFSIYAFGGGATRVISLDSSRPALNVAMRNLEINNFAEIPGQVLKADAFTYLKETDARFDVIVLDPPSLARKGSDVSAATGGYKFLNLHALRHLNQSGVLLTFSCSQHLSIDLFQKVVFGAAVDAGRRVQILKRLSQPIDHPVSLHHPEGEYLKGLALRVLD